MGNYRDAFHLTTGIAIGWFVADLLVGKFEHAAFIWPMWAVYAFIVLPRFYR